jgi:hypothetical protein
MVGCFLCIGEGIQAFSEFSMLSEEKGSLTRRSSSLTRRSSIWMPASTHDR